MIKTFSITASNGVPFNVRIVFFGDKYGREDCLTHMQEFPLVEFYDARFMHTKHGQFVSRYYVQTVLDHDPLSGLCLDGGVPDWTIDLVSWNVICTWLTMKLAMADLESEMIDDEEWNQGDGQGA